MTTPDAYAAAGEALSARGRFRRAADQLRRARAEGADCAPALAAALLAGGRSAEALTLANLPPPLRAELWVDAAWRDAARRDAAAARVAALGEGPAAMWVRGQWALLEGRPGDALDCFRAGAGHPDPWSDCSMALCEALEALDGPHARATAARYVESRARLPAVHFGRARPDGALLMAIAGDRAGLAAMAEERRAMMAEGVVNRPDEAQLFAAAVAMGERGERARARARAAMSEERAGCLVKEIALRPGWRRALGG